MKIQLCGFIVVAMAHWMMVSAVEEKPKENCFTRLQRTFSSSLPKKLQGEFRPWSKKLTKPRSEWTQLNASKQAQNTLNTIWHYLDRFSVPPNPKKAVIRFNLGDPTVGGVLPPSEAAVAAMIQVLKIRQSDGYCPAVGLRSARNAVAQHFSMPGSAITADEIVLTSGAAHALELAISAIADPGQNILIPQPGFPQFHTLCRSNQIEAREYRLRIDLDGLVDLKHLESQIDAKTRAIIVNNPANPTGRLFPKEHLQQILQLAQKYKVPIIADETYRDLVHDKTATFHTLFSLSPRVPIITIDGIGKRYMVPGWRLGWLIVHNRFGVLTNVKRGIVALSQKIVGPCSIVQAALPQILDGTPPSFFENTRNLVRSNAQIVEQMLGQVPGLKLLRPQSTMYYMIRTDPEMYGEELEFVRQLVAQESLYCLPGSMFSLPNSFRLVLGFSPETIREACERIIAYCSRLRSTRKKSLS